MAMNLVHFKLIFRKYLIALITHYCLQNVIGMEYHIHRITLSFHISRIELIAPK